MGHRSRRRPFSSGVIATVSLRSDFLASILSESRRREGSIISGSAVCKDQGRCEATTLAPGRFGHGDGGTRAEQTKRWATSWDDRAPPGDTGAVARTTSGFELVLEVWVETRDTWFGQGRSAKHRRNNRTLAAALASFHSHTGLHATCRLRAASRAETAQHDSLSACSCWGMLQRGAACSFRGTIGSLA